MFRHINTGLNNELSINVYLIDLLKNSQAMQAPDKACF